MTCSPNNLSQPPFPTPPMPLLPATDARSDAKMTVNSLPPCSELEAVADRSEYPPPPFPLHCKTSEGS